MKPSNSQPATCCNKSDQPRKATPSHADCVCAVLLGSGNRSFQFVVQLGAQSEQLGLVHGCSLWPRAASARTVPVTSPPSFKILLESHLCSSFLFMQGRSLERAEGRTPQTRTEEARRIRTLIGDICTEVGSIKQTTDLQQDVLLERDLKRPPNQRQAPTQLQLLLHGTSRSRNRNLKTESIKMKSNSMNNYRNMTAIRETSGKTAAAAAAATAAA